MGHLSPVETNVEQNLFRTLAKVKNKRWTAAAIENQSEQKSNKPFSYFRKWIK